MDIEPKREVKPDNEPIVYGADDATGNQVSTAVPPTGSEGSITWTASEFVAHQKSPSWYLLLVAGSIVLAAIFWLLTKDILTSSTVLVAAIMLIVVGSKKPRELTYHIDNKGLSIGDKSFPFDQFRSFSVYRQGAFCSLVFKPLKRFAFLTTVNYDPADETKIMDILTSYLPVEEQKRDFIDDLMWKVRF